MNKFLTTKAMPWAVLAAGILGGLSRALLFSSGVDHKNLLISGHFSYWILWILSIGVAAVLFFGTRNLKQATRYSFNFPRSAIACLGTAAAGLYLLISSISLLLAPEDDFTTLLALAGILAGGALGFLGFCRWEGSHPSPLFHCAVCVYLMLRLVYQYRVWSADPQLQDYLFSLLALIFTLLSCYYSATFAAKEGRRQLHTITHLAAVYCCLVTMPHCEAPLLYVFIALWLFTNLCNLTPLIPESKEG